MTALTLRTESLDQICAEWEGLLSQTAAPIPFATPAWQRVWLKHFQGDRELLLLTARDGERLIGIAPLLRDGERAELVGHYSICDYMDVVCTPGFETSLLTSTLKQLAADGVEHIDFRGLRETSPTVPALEAAAASAGFNLDRQQEAVSPVVDLPASWEDYLGSLSKKDRHELRRKLRRLESAGGNVEMRITNEPDEACAWLDTLFRLMRLSNHHKEEFLARSGMEDFFREMTSVMASEKMLRFYSLNFDDQPVAMVLNFDLGGRLYMYNSGYDPDYSHYAVGLMSKTLLIKDAIEIGRTAVDFMRGDEAYKYDLGGKDLAVARAVLTR